VVNKELADVKQVHRLPPLDYPSLMLLMESARFVLTDSGGIQEETTALGVPCLTARENTERPITITEGTNTLVGTDPEVILDHIEKHLKNKMASTTELPKPLYWDGKTANRIVDAILKYVW
jgi:UDP-N-acetylglucosamine 2-epimerase (non-hydrolysing)